MGWRGEAMRSEGEIRYAKVGITPEAWNLMVFDWRGLEVKGVIEVDCNAGILFRYATDPQGRFYLCDGNPRCDQCSEEPHISVICDKGTFTIMRIERG